MTETKQTKEEVMDKQTLAEIKKQLLTRKEQLQKELEEITNGGNGVKFPEYGDKIDENAQEIGDFSTNLATDKVLESTLRDIENTLKRIEKGNYGICKYCGQPISKKRLLARPVASACVQCKTKLQNNA